MNTDKPITPDDDNESDDLNFDDLDITENEEVIEIDLDDIEDMDMSEPIDVSEIPTEDIESISAIEPVEDEFAGTSKHKISGKHALKFDTIFKGKRETLSEDDAAEPVITNDNWSPDITTNFHYEVYQNDKYIREKDLKEKLYNVLKHHTNVDFDCNRRKPSRVDFNNYFFIVKTELKDDKFSNIELFNELSFYFSDNLMNMFKLLDNKWRNLIISELQEHIGKVNSDKSVTHKNLPIGSEIEFRWVDPITTESIIITGEVRSYDRLNDDEYIYVVNSYENEYRLELCEIDKILNNTKFKYNLNKLNNIDFL